MSLHLSLLVYYRRIPIKTQEKYIYFLVFILNGGTVKLKRILLIILFLLVLYTSWPLIEKQINHSDYAQDYQTMKSEINTLIEDANLSSAIETISHSIREVIRKLDVPIENLGKDGDQPLKTVEKPNLETPDQHVFSIHNIELGDSNLEVEEEVGKAKRTSSNEYGTKWYTYHQDYQNFMMVSLDENGKVNGLFTNQDLISSSTGIKLGTSKNSVNKNLGQPITKIRKGLTYYQIDGKQEYDTYLLDGSYITIFYDQHQNNTVDAIQIIKEELEMDKEGFYGKATSKLREGLELQLFDLTNAARVKHGLKALTWDDQVKETARDHSKDMSVNNYFSHTNLEGESPFDRMEEDQIRYTLAGENLAYGQFSSIFAHEGLMNSLGHRKNILQKDFRYLGVGVAFNKESIPYYTENFYTK